MGVARSVHRRENSDQALLGVCGGVCACGGAGDTGSDGAGDVQTHGSCAHGRQAFGHRVSDCHGETDPRDCRSGVAIADPIDTAGSGLLDACARAAYIDCAARAACVTGTDCTDRINSINSIDCAVRALVWVSTGEGPIPAALNGFGPVANSRQKRPAVPARLRRKGRSVLRARRCGGWHSSCDCMKTKTRGGHHVHRKLSQLVSNRNPGGLLDFDGRPVFGDARFAVSGGSVGDEARVDVAFDAGQPGPASRQLATRCDVRRRLRIGQAGANRFSCGCSGSTGIGSPGEVFFSPGFFPPKWKQRSLWLAGRSGLK